MKPGKTLSAVMAAATIASSTLTFATPAAAQNRELQLNCLGTWLSMQMYTLSYRQTGDPYYRDAAGGQRSLYSRWCSR